jgi:hypothetical protein
MLKLYKRIKRALHYHEAWAEGAKVLEHWGKIGERGDNAEHKRNKKLGEEQNLKQVLSKPLAEGYQPIDDEDHAVLLVEYALDGMGNTKDLDKRHALEERMNETLGGRGSDTAMGEVSARGPWTFAATWSISRSPSALSKKISRIRSLQTIAASLTSAPANLRAHLTAEWNPRHPTLRC